MPVSPCSNYHREHVRLPGITGREVVLDQCGGDAPPTSMCSFSRCADLWLDTSGRIVAHVLYLSESAANGALRRRFAQCRSTRSLPCP